MGLFDFLKFWKKKGELGAEKGFEMPEMPKDLGMPPGMEQPPGMPPGPPDLGPPEMPDLGPPPSFQPTSSMAPEQPPMFGAPEPRMQPFSAQPPASSGDNREFQLINAKLDTIKAGIDSIHQRLDKMELEKKKEEKEVYAWR